MSVYTVSRSNVALSTSNDLLTITPAANRRVQIIEISVAGMGTASAANELGVYDVTTAGVTGSGALTPTKLDRFAPSPASTVNSAWTTQPVVGGEILSLGVNSNGGIYRWVARPGEEINVTGSATTNFQLSLRAAVGSGNVSVHVVFSEDPL
jgi:hypothetical protein